ncbi:MAG: peptide transporter permease [Frankiales bacterium]|nr:peptide transporter permease [Frankiales bacterium]
MTATTTEQTSTATPSWRRRSRPDNPRRMFALKGNVGFYVGLTVLILLVLLGIIFPLIAGKGTVANPINTLAAPSAKHWFGTDEYGRDILVRCIGAIQSDLFLAMAVTAVGLLIGSVLGSLSATVGGWFDTVVMRFTDILMAFPAFVLALVISASLGNSAMHAAIGVAIAYIPQFVRLTRSQALQVRSSDFVAASRVSGTSTLVIALQHVLPNSFRAPLIQGTLIAAWSILDLAGLSFLGVGVQPPTPEWGQMISVGSGDVLLGDWWTALFPGLMIVISASAFQLIGDRLERSIR